MIANQFSNQFSVNCSKKIRQRKEIESNFKALQFFSILLHENNLFLKAISKNTISKTEV